MSSGQVYAATTVTLTANPTTIFLGQSTVLTWSTTNASSCTATGSWTGSKATSGTTTITPGAAGTFTYTLTCNTVASSATVTVNPPQLTISQSPLTTKIPAHPQVLFAVGNSESMDGNLAGAIMTGSGSLGSSLSLLQNTSSPTCFTIPTGFTPPLSGSGTGGCAAGSAPYTISSGGTLYDNSPSRLNVAKAGIAAVLNSFMPTADFGLETYSLSSTSLYTTWLYQMSPSTGNFTFTSTQTAGNRYVANPCLGYTAVQTTNATIYNDCHAIDASTQVTGHGTLNTAQYMQVSPTNAGSSDDPLINDVLYAGSGIDPICLAYGGPTPANPYTGTGSFSLSTYNSGGVSESYSSQINNCARTTTPTNAGFVPYTPETMYIQRGFGYGGSQSATTGTTKVGITSAGQVPTASSVATAIATFTPYLNPETNSTGTTEIKAAAGQSGLAGLLGGAYTYFTTTTIPTSNGCTAAQYVILVTDGLPTLDTSGKFWPPPGTVSATGYGMTVAFNADGSLNAGSTNDQALKDTITKLAALSSAGIKTYVVGLGAGVDPTQNPTASQVLTAMAIAGGTGNANPTLNTYNSNIAYGYFPATSPSALVSDLSSILQTIIGATQSVATSAVNSTGLNTNTAVYRAQFSTQDTYQDWTGDMSAFPVSVSTGVVSTTASWQAENQLNSITPASRVIATWDPSASDGIPFEWCATAGSCSNGATSGIVAGSTLAVQLTSSTITPVSSDTDGLRRLNYLRGDSSYEKTYNPTSGQFRNRTRGNSTTGAVANSSGSPLGDIIDSSPLYVGAPPGNYGFNSYSSFRSYYSSGTTSRTPMIYVGANDGMLHAFNASTGNELFAYIPNGVFANLPMLTSPFYNAQHHYFVDGSPQAGDVTFSTLGPDGSTYWHTILVSGENGGGNTVFALDVTDPSSLTSESSLAAAALWEFSDSDMGLSYSTPAIVPTNATVNGQNPGFVVFFGNGYNSSRGRPILYAVNPQTGAQIAKIDLCNTVANSCNFSLPNGLSSITAINSGGAVSTTADTLYAGDLQGNLWRVNISSSLPATWGSSVSLLFKAKDTQGTGSVQPITVAPAAGLNPLFPRLLGPMVFFGTGQLLTLGDLTNSQVQDVYGIYDPGIAAAGTGPTYTDSNLVAQTLSLSTSNPSAVVGSGNSVNLASCSGTTPSQCGWYIDLTLNARLRNVTQPRVESGGAVVLTVYEPISSQCTQNDLSYLLVLNFATGGTFSLPEFIIPGNTSLDSSQVDNGKNPVGYLLSGFAASPTIISINGGPSGGNQLKIVTESTNSTPTFPDRGGSQQRRAWWELQQ